MSKKKNEVTEASTTVEADGLEEFYKEEQTIFRKPLIQSVTALRAYYFFVCLLFGILGGILGELYINNYFNSQGLPLTTLWQQTNSSGEADKQQVIILRSDQTNKKESDLNTLVEAAGASVVGIFQAKTTGETMWDSIYLPSEQLGNGLILTADGWIVTSELTIPDNAKNLVVILADKNILTVARIIKDYASGATFLKVNAQGLKVVKFGSRDNWSPGEQLLVLANSVANGGIKAIMTNLEKTNYQLLTKSQDFIQSSEVYKKKILLKDTVGKEFFGSPVVNLQGEIIGIVYGGVTANLLLPQDYFSEVLKSLMATDALSRPYLGVNYLDLAHIVGIDKNISESRTSGAVLYGEKGTLPAVMPESPAAQAGLKAGDIIIKINNESVDSKHSLTELVQQYKVGDALKLTVIFQGNEREIEAVLVAPPAPEI
jgi:S1-C subfamily serine protease